VSLTVISERYVVGVPLCVPEVANAPHGSRIRFRFRQEQFAQVFVRRGNSVTRHYLLQRDDYYLLGTAVGRNVKIEGPKLAAEPRSSIRARRILA
jgi:hypothetical protein